MTVILTIMSVLLSSGIFYLTGLYTEWYFYFIPVLLLFPAYIAAFLVHIILAGFVGLFVNKKKPVKKPSKYFYKITVESLKQVMMFSNTKVYLSGAEKLPDGRFLMVYNHISNFDPLVILTAIPNREIVLVSKPENEKLPIVGKYMHMSGFLTINRTSPVQARSTVTKSVEWLSEDVASVAISPEGTRSKSGKLLPFKAAPFSIAKKTAVPIVMVTVKNTNKIAKNFPFKRTKVYLDIAEVIGRDEIDGLTSIEMSELVRAKMLSALGEEEN